jgi:hypothetical protein
MNVKRVGSGPSPFDDIWIAVSGTGCLQSSILLAKMQAIMAVLGSGALSIEALHFSRRRLDI